MYFNIDGRNLEYRNKLKNFIENSYSLKIISIIEHNRGFYGETWKIECIKNKLFFVKIIYFERQAKKYIKCFDILDFMEDNGIDFVSQVIKTTCGNHYIFFNEGTLALFKFVHGTHAEDKPTTFVPYMVRIYNLSITENMVEKEDFSSDIFNYLEQQVIKLHNDTEILNIIHSNWTLLLDVNKKHEQFSLLCRKKHNKFVITSGDIGGNTLVYNGKINIIDWDWIKLAPPERDFWWYVQNIKQITDINLAFQHEGFDYSLDNDNLGYYAFFSYIYFLTEYIDSYLFNPLSRLEVIKSLKNYFKEDNGMLKCIANIRC